MSARIEFTQPINNTPVPLNLFYGAFSDNQNQSILAPFNVVNIKLANTDFSNGVVLGVDNLVFLNAGIYNIQLSLQVTNSAVQAHEFYFWFALNNNYIPNSSSISTIASKHGGVNGHLIISMNLFVQVSAGDNVSLFWTADNISIRIESITPPLGLPTAPSVIITATQVSWLYLHYVNTI